MPARIPSSMTTSRKRPAEQDPGTDVGTPAMRQHRKLLSQKLHGVCPPYNDKACWVGDPFEHKAYMFGGERPDEKNIPTSDFYCLDTTSMMWRDLTKTLKFRRPDALLSRDECIRDVTDLPQLSLPACTLLRLHNTSFLLIFGGFDVEAEVASSTLIIISLRHHEWWFANIQGGPVAGRIDPSIVSIGNNLYIFGGYNHFSGDGTPHNSYCIATLSDDGSTWNWEASDVPYSSDVPGGTLFGKATPVFNGSKILLTPWRATQGGALTFTNKNIFCFHIERRKFQSADFIGDFPKNIGWYSTYPLDAPFNPHTPSTTLSASPKRRGRPPKYPRVQQPSQTLSTPAYHPATTSILTSSVLICGWVEGELAAELWRLEVTPSERFTKLNISPMTRELDHSFEGSMLLGRRFLLFGSQTARSPNEPDSDSDYPASNYDIYLDVPVAW